MEREQELHPAAKREVEPEEPQGFFARLERSALAADAEKVVAKGELRLMSCSVVGRPISRPAIVSFARLLNPFICSASGLSPRICRRRSSRRPVKKPWPTQTRRALSPAEALAFSADPGSSNCGPQQLSVMFRERELRVSRTVFVVLISFQEIIEECKEVDVVDILKSLKNPGSKHSRPQAVTRDKEKLSRALERYRFL